MKPGKFRAQTGMTVRLAALTLALWLLGMACATIATAEVLCGVLDQSSSTFLADLYGRARLDSAFELEQTQPGLLAYRLWEALDSGTSRSVTLPSVSDGGPRLLRDKTLDQQTAVVILNADGTTFGETGDFFYFSYQTEAHWAAGAPDEQSDGFARAVLDRSKMSASMLGTFDAATFEFDLAALRLTGQLDGEELTVSAIDYVSDGELREALNSTEPDESVVSADGLEETRFYDATVSDLMRETGLSWRSLYTDPDAAAGPESVTLYAIHPNASAYLPGDAVTYHGETYESLLALTRDCAPAFLDGFLDCRSSSLTERIRIQAYYLFEDADADTARYVMVAATQSRPLRDAMTALRSVYLWSFLLAGAGFLLVWSALRKRLTRPVADLAAGAADGWSYLGSPEHWPRGFSDVAALYDHYDEARIRFAAQREQIARLERAAQYAAQSEQNRRQMTSHIAHELKTPLAVLSSYAEGLREHIADDKRDHYLDVISGEVTRMDAMVREMLDLSRLEAGRVALRRETFSLASLTREVVDRLGPAARGRGLTFALDLEEPARVEADRARLEQVVTNLVSNAVRYASGGEIRITLHAQRGGVRFRIENDAPPLPEQALGKLFDSFYRADESRTGPGTGLGLAICKSIVSLHGGTIAARSTAHGLEISFTL